MSETMVKIENGRTIDFPDGRSVFISVVPDHDMVAIGFLSKDGEVTKLTLSTEGAAALAELITNPLAGRQSEPPAPAGWVYSHRAEIRAAGSVPRS